jgi:hypothetical protein
MISKRFMITPLLLLAVSACNTQPPAEEQIEEVPAAEVPVPPQPASVIDTATAVDTLAPAPAAPGAPTAPPTTPGG